MTAIQDIDMGRGTPQNLTSYLILTYESDHSEQDQLLKSKKKRKCRNSPVVCAYFFIVPNIESITVLKTPKYCDKY